MTRHDPEIEELREKVHCAVVLEQSKRDLTAAGRYAAIACEPALVHFQGSSSSIFVLG